MKRKLTLLVVAAALCLVSAGGIAGGCLQGTWTYLDNSGRVVGAQTMGCGELDGAWGQVTENKTFAQGCGVSSF